MQIAFIGFGEAARAFTDSLREHDGSLRIQAWDILLDDAARSEEMAEAMRSRGVARAEDAAALGEADWIFSAVTADQSHIAAEAVAPWLGDGRTFIDINSVSPGRKRESAALIEGRGAHYVDMAVMAPVHPQRHRAPVLVAGRRPEATDAALARLDFNFRVISDQPGEATAIKMIRSLFVKGLETLTVEALLAAEAAGCFDEILTSLSSSFPGLGWPDHADYQFERTLRHGRRRAAEMRESAATYDELGLHGALAAEVAAVQEAMGAVGGQSATDPLQDVVRAVLARRLGR
ncbi:NAD(P)-dependent oxidoreductase [Rhodobacteraceae bacterium MCCB 386]|nr:NAD(P)-dependent oxidoreductase [Roseitranquillus sediminis]